MGVSRIKNRLRRLSFRTGVTVLALCVPCYLLSFAPMLTGMSASACAVIWTVMFGLAKTFQYAGLTIIGAEGVRRLKLFFKRTDTKKE